MSDDGRETEVRIAVGRAASAIFHDSVADAAQAPHQAFGGHYRHHARR